jgi:hypothetical protein
MKKRSREGSSQDIQPMREEYDFAGGVRGKHSQVLQSGYTITIHKGDGTRVVKRVQPTEGTVVLEPEVRAYFPDSESVNTALRNLISLIPTKRRRVSTRSRGVRTIG